MRLLRTADAAIDRAVRALRPHRYALAPSFLVLLVFGWMVTYGTGGLFDKESFAEFYDGQARSLLAGRLDVPRRYILDEAYVRDGKSYGYYGFAPALLHVPVVLLFPDTDARWARLSELAACAVSLWYTYRILLEARAASGLAPALDRRSRAVYSFFLLTSALSSTLLFLASRSYVFHEAIIWGAAFALGSYAHLSAYLAHRRLRSLAAAGAFSFLAFFSRASVGAGTLAALLLTAWVDAVTAKAQRQAPEARRRSSRHAAVAAGVVGLCLATFVTINYLKFRTYFEAIPSRFYVQYLSNPQRLRRIGGKQAHLSNLPTAARAYLGPTNLRLSPHFPWVYPLRTARVYPEARYDLIEPYAGLPAVSPVPCALALAGLASVLASVLLCRLRARPRSSPAGTEQLAGTHGTGAKPCPWWPLIPMAGAALGGTVAMSADVITFRYLHDAYPFLIVCGAFGAHALFLRPKTLHPAARHAIVALALAAAAFGIWANFSLALVYQRT